MFLISPYMYCKSCGEEHFIGEEGIKIKDIKRGFIWKCKACGQENKWIRPDDQGGTITL